MWILVLMALLFVVTPSFAEQSFSEKYERDYNIFNPANRSRESSKSAESSWEVLGPES